MIYPELETGNFKLSAKKYLRGGFGGLVGFELKGGIDAGKKFIDNLELFYHVANIGDSRSLAIHPASTTHQQLNDAEKKSSGVSDDLIRVSVGLENIDDIKADFEQAFN